MREVSYSLLAHNGDGTVVALDLGDKSSLAFLCALANYCTDVARRNQYDSGYSLFAQSLKDSPFALLGSLTMTGTSLSAFWPVADAL